MTENLEEAQVENVVDTSLEQEDPKAKMQREYLQYAAEIEAGRFVYDNPKDILEAVNTICKVLSMTTVVPRTELKNVGDKREPAIIGGTHIDLIKSQYPGVYPILMQRLLDLTVKL